MDKSKQAKLVELRKKKALEKKQSDATKHSELISELRNLHNIFENGQENDQQRTSELLNKLSELNAFTVEIKKVRDALENLPTIDSITISNIDDLVASQKELDLTEVVEAVKQLSTAVKNQIVDEVTIKNKTPKDFIPTRRVREANGVLIYDDAPMQVSVTGGGSIATVQKELIRDNAIAVVNPDGTPITAGSTSVVLTERFAEAGGYDYIGEAPVGTLTSQNLWTISRYSPTEGKVAVNAIWDNYLTETYL